MPYSSDHASQSVPEADMPTLPELFAAADAVIEGSTIDYSYVSAEPLTEADYAQMTPETAAICREADQAMADYSAALSACGEQITQLSAAVDEFSTEGIADLRTCEYWLSE